MKPQGIFPLRVDFPEGWFEHMAQPEPEAAEADAYDAPDEGEEGYDPHPEHREYEELKERLARREAELAELKMRYEKKPVTVKPPDSQRKSTDWKRAVILSELLDKPLCMRKKR